MHNFPMTWKESGFEYAIGVELSENDASFLSEPELGQQRILRGTFDIGPAGNKESVGFIWAKSDGKLYVDLNCDGDLTNDPNGVLERVVQERDFPDFNQQFPAFLLSFSSEWGKYRYQVKIVLIDTTIYHQAWILITSGYSGIIELGEKRWDIGVVCFDGEIGDEAVLLVGVSGADPNFMSESGIPQKLFLNGRCYDVAFEFQGTGSDFPQLWCRLTKKDVPLGNFRLECPGIQALILANDQMLIFPDLGQESTQIPVGQYHSEKLVWGSEYVTPYYPNAINVTAEEEYVLRAGIPLKSSVQVERVGSFLQFNYQLTGIGQESYSVYQVTGYDLSKMPSFAIYKGDLKVGVGTFEYG